MSPKAPTTALMSTLRTPLTTSDAVDDLGPGGVDLPDVGAGEDQEAAEGQGGAEHGDGGHGGHPGRALGVPEDERGHPEADDEQQELS